MELLAKNYSMHRELEFYADKLCITSRHLSSICKNERTDCQGMYKQPSYYKYKDIAGNNRYDYLSDFGRIKFSECFFLYQVF